MVARLLSCLVDSRNGILDRRTCPVPKLSWLFIEDTCILAASPENLARSTGQYAGRTFGSADVRDGALRGERYFADRELAMMLFPTPTLCDAGVRSQFGIWATDSTTFGMTLSSDRRR